MHQEDIKHGHQQIGQICQTEPIHEDGMDSIDRIDSTDWIQSIDWINSMDWIDSMD